MNQTTNQELAEKILICDSASERAKGMLRFKEAPKNLAMIFQLPLLGIFPLIHSLGMKFPIDLFFLDKQKNVLSMKRNFKPGRFFLPWPYIFSQSRYLVEASSDLELKISLNDQLKWSQS